MCSKFGKKALLVLTRCSIYMIALVRVCLFVFWVQSPAKRIASLALSSFAVEGGAGSY